QCPRYRPREDAPGTWGCALYRAKPGRAPPAGDGIRHVAALPGISGYAAHRGHPACLLYLPAPLAGRHLDLPDTAASDARGLSEDDAEHAAYAPGRAPGHCATDDGHPEHHRGPGALQCLEYRGAPPVALCGPAHCGQYGYLDARPGRVAARPAAR